jgi:hypothetical protein
LLVKGVVRATTVAELDAGLPLTRLGTLAFGGDVTLALARLCR